MKCPKCQVENPEGKRFCRKCGTPLPLTCTHCGAQIMQDDEFCGDCGHPLTSVPPLIDLTHLRTDGPELPAEKIPTTSSNIGGERKHVTILFSDLSGYTTLSETLDPEELKEFTSSLFGDITKVIEQYGGFVEKYIGDAVMAVFGVPSAHEDDRCGPSVQQGRSIGSYRTRAPASPCTQGSIAVSSSPVR